MEPEFRIAGLRPNYISAQPAFRCTRTAKAPDCMQTVAACLTEADVTAVAARLASRPAPATASREKAHILAFACGSNQIEGHDRNPIMAP
jgi:cytochrome c553